jgi:hypothetical protein
VGVADVGPDADLGFRDTDEGANFAWMVHAEFDHRDLRPRAQLEQRQRQADVVVQVPRVAEHPVARREELRRGLLRRRFARAPGNGHHLRPGPPAHVAGQLLQRPRRVRHLDEHAGPPFTCLKGGRRTLDHRARCAFRQRVGNERVTVEPLAADRHEQLARRDGPRVDRYAGDLAPGVARDQPPAGGGRDLPGGQRQRRHALRHLRS